MARRSIRSTLGLLAAAALVVGPGLAAVRLVPALAGFLIFALGGVVAILVGITSVVQAARGRGLTRGGAAALVGAAVFLSLAARGGDAPRINDFTTNLADPPAFRHATTLPANAGRDMSYPAAFAEEQRACCADLAPARVGTDAASALARARYVAGTMPGWTVTAADPATGTMEAVATSRLFGFQDDIVIRVRPDGAAGAVVDMRSKSRDGKGDLGANAARIRVFLRALTEAR